MKKIFVNFLLLSVVLLNGYSYLLGATTNAPVKNAMFSTENVSCAAHGKNHTYITKASLVHFEKLNCEIEITDSEDDETSSSKKELKASPYFAKSSASPQRDNILDYIQQASFLKKFSHLLSCKKYILLQVFRI